MDLDEQPRQAALEALRELQTMLAKNHAEANTLERDLNV